MIPANVGIIDLETLPADATVGMDLSQPPGWEPPEIEPKPVEQRTVPANYKDEAKIEAWQEGEWRRYYKAVGEAQVAAEKAQDAERAKALQKWRDGALDPYRGRIACIGLALGEEDPVVIDCAEDEEAGLRELGALIVERRQQQFGGPPITWVAHNGLTFDFPMLQLRALKYGSTALARRYHQDKPWDGVLIDTREWWPTTGRYGGKSSAKLDTICDHLGIERPDNPIDGSGVLDAYVEGRWPDVVAHCRADVRDLREVFRVLREVRGDG